MLKQYKWQGMSTQNWQFFKFIPRIPNPNSANSCKFDYKLRSSSQVQNPKSIDEEIVKMGSLYITLPLPY